MKSTTKNTVFFSTSLSLGRRHVTTSCAIIPSWESGVLRSNIATATSTTAARAAPIVTEYLVVRNTRPKAPSDARVDLTEATRPREPADPPVDPEVIMPPTNLLPPDREDIATTLTASR